MGRQGGMERCRAGTAHPLPDGLHTCCGAVLRSCWPWQPHLTQRAAVATPQHAHRCAALTCCALPRLQLFPTRLGEKLSLLTAGSEAEVFLEPGAVLRQGSALRQGEAGRVEVVLGAGNQVGAACLHACAC